MSVASGLVVGSDRNVTRCLFLSTLESCSAKPSVAAMSTPSYDDLSAERSDEQGKCTLEHSDTIRRPAMARI